MKKYLRKIEWLLALPRDIRKRVMEDLTSTIQERREAGQSEAEIMAELGSPKKVAEELNRQMREYVRPKSPWRFACLAVAVLSGAWLILYAVLTSVLSGFLTKEAESLGIIGGADGPTAIFVTAAPGVDWDFILMAILCLAGLVGYFWLRRGRRK